MAGEFDEAKHGRATDGKFAAGGGSGAKSGVGDWAKHNASKKSPADVQVQSDRAHDFGNKAHAGNEGRESIDDHVKAAKLHREAASALRQLGGPEKKIASKMAKEHDAKAFRHDDRVVALKPRDPNKASEAAHAASAKAFGDKSETMGHRYEGTAWSAGNMGDKMQAHGQAAILHRTAAHLQRKAGDEKKAREHDDMAEKHVRAKEDVKADPGTKAQGKPDRKDFKNDVDYVRAVHGHNDQKTAAANKEFDEGFSRGLKSGKGLDAKPKKSKTEKNAEKYPKLAEKAEAATEKARALEGNASSSWDDKSKAHRAASEAHRRAWKVSPMNGGPEIRRHYSAMTSHMNSQLPPKKEG